MDLVLARMVPKMTADTKRLRIVTVQHPQIAKILTEIHGDNGGCTATEWEKCLEDFTNDELHCLAAGEEGDREKLLTKMKDAATLRGYNTTQALSLVLRFEAWLNAAFD